jgi:hypothetical protein
MFAQAHIPEDIDCPHVSEEEGGRAYNTMISELFLEVKKLKVQQDKTKRLLGAVKECMDGGDIRSDDAVRDAIRAFEHDLAPILTHRALGCVGNGSRPMFGSQKSDIYASQKSNSSQKDTYASQKSDTYASQKSNYASQRSDVLGDAAMEGNVVPSHMHVSPRKELFSPQKEDSSLQRVVLKAELEQKQMEAASLFVSARLSHSGSSASRVLASFRARGLA